MRLLKPVVIGLMLSLGSSGAYAQNCSGQTPPYSWCGNRTAAQTLPSWTNNPIAVNFTSRATNVVSAGATTVLTAASTRFQNLTGSSTQTFQLPDATTLVIGATFQFNNNSTGVLTVVNNSSSTITTVPAGGIVIVTAIAVSTAAGAWDFHPSAPSNIQWGTTGLQFNGSSSGSVTIGVAAAAGTNTLFQLPSSNGTNSQVLSTDGSGHTSWTSIAGTGTVTSVGLSLPGIFTVSGSPVTSSGTLTGTLANQSANLVWSGPTTGAAAAPTFRSLVGADLPNPGASSLGGVQSFAGVSSQWIRQISTSGVVTASQPAFSDISGAATTGQLPSTSSILDLLGSTQGNVLYRSASGWTVLAPGTSGQVLTTAGAAANPSWTSVGGTGTVTNVATSGGVTGGPITTTGTISLTPIASNTVLANIAVGTNAPGSTTPSAILDTFGTAQGSILYRGASSWTALGPGTSGQILQSTGAGSNPSWVTNATVSIDAGGATAITNGKARDFLTQSNAGNVSHSGLPYFSFAIGAL